MPDRRVVLAIGGLVLWGLLGSAAGQPAPLDAGAAARLLAADTLVSAGQTCGVVRARAERRARERELMASPGLLKLLGGSGSEEQPSMDSFLGGALASDLDAALGGLGGVDPGERGFGGLGNRGGGAGGGLAVGGGAVGLGHLGPSRPAPKVQLAEGGPEALRAHARRKLPRLELCYRTALTGSAGLAGEIELELAADVEGKVRVLAVRGAGPAGLHACLRSAALGRLAAVPGAPLTGTLKFTLDPGTPP